MTCIEWKGSVNNGGYGTLTVDGVTLLAHRWQWELAYGTIPPRSDVDHLCRNRKCINVEHMELVSRQENLLRGRGYGGELRTHCKRGHELAGDNLQLESNGYYRCRACRKLTRQRKAA